MDRPVLPQFFREKDVESAVAARRMSDMQFRLFSHYEQELSFLNDSVYIDRLKQTRTYRYFPATLIKFPSGIWDKMSAVQKTDIRERYTVMEESGGEWISNVQGVINVRSFESTLADKGFRLENDHDYEVEPGILRYISDPMTENWDSTGFQVNIKGRPTPVSAVYISGVFTDITFSQDWYYKRMGILLGLPEDTDPYKVMAMYQLVCGGVNDRSMNAFIEAYSGYGISLRSDRVVSVKPPVIRSENEVYPVPSVSSVSVNSGQLLTPGQPLFRALFPISDSTHPLWASNTGIINLLTAVDPGFITDIMAVVSTNPRLKWGEPLPVRLSEDDEQSAGLWIGAPVVSLPVLKFVAGSDPDFTGSASYDNILMYSTLDIPVDVTDVTISYDNVTGSVSIDKPVAETVTPEHSGIFKFSSGISGRIMDTGISDTWNGDITQTRDQVSVTVNTDSNEVEFDFIHTVFNDRMEPEVGDWVWIKVGDVWKKLCISDLEYDAEIAPVKARAPRYGITPAIVPGTYTAVIFRSFNGEPYTGVDDAIIDSFQELLNIVSRHIEVVVIDGSILDKSTVKSLLRTYSDKLSIWKAFVVIAAPDTKKFIELMGVING